MHPVVWGIDTTSLRRLMSWVAGKWPEKCLTGPDLLAGASATTCSGIDRCMRGLGQRVLQVVVEDLEDDIT